VELVRHLPASEAASELARPAIDLATGERIPRSLASDLGSLAYALLTPAVSSADVRTCDLRVCCEPPSIRLEVRWVAGEPARPVPDAPGQDPDLWTGIASMADRWGFSHDHRRRCVWAERFTDPDPRTWPDPPQVSAA
jgi:hypothetical protein